jgi:hypothetical protein
MKFDFYYMVANENGDEWKKTWGTRVMDGMCALSSSSTIMGPHGSCQRMDVETESCIFAAPVVLVGYCFDANTPFFLTLLVFAAKLFLKSFLIFNYFFTVFFSLMCCYPKQILKNILF